MPLEARASRWIQQTICQCPQGQNTSGVNDLVTSQVKVFLNLSRLWCQCYNTTTYQTSVGEVMTNILGISDLVIYTLQLLCKGRWFLSPTHTINSKSLWTLPLHSIDIGYSAKKWALLESCGSNRHYPVELL